ncbi:MAG UNVERIFIED_CONTAM: hypothetical protein LVR29_05255 [Microcystis novacekii LVE1205-3]|jgi:hypothetical protein
MAAELLADGQTCDALIFLRRDSRLVGATEKKTRPQKATQKKTSGKGLKFVSKIIFSFLSVFFFFWGGGPAVELQVLSQPQVARKSSAH